MAKREQAFELFNQGKGLGDPEVVALGLAKKTLRMYYRDWGKSQAKPAIEAEPPHPAVTVGSLPIGAYFELGGVLYRKYEVQAGKVVGLDVEETQLLNQMRKKALEQDTLVIPK